VNALLFMHIAGAVLLIGNAVTAAFWKIRSDLGRDPRTAHQTAKNIMIADYVFTLPGIVLILVSGHFLAARAGYTVFEWSWLGLSYGLFLLSGVIWLAALFPAQRAMIRHSRLSAERGALTKEYERASRVWNAWGTAATLLPIAALVLMTWKPEL